MQLVKYSKKIETLLSSIKSDIAKEFKDCKTIAIKIHFGEPGNKYSLKPDDVKPITDLLKDLDIDFFFFDSSVVYGGERGDPISHKRWAEKKGWTRLGKVVTDDDFINVKGKYMDYEVCSKLGEADGVLVISHVKGHSCTGFGAAIKNLGMGAVTKISKSKIHDGGKPLFTGRCTGCKACQVSCPLDSLKVDNVPIFKDPCFGCSACVYACPQNSIKPKFETFDNLLADSANSAQSTFKKKYYISLMINITKKCDCTSDPGKVIAKDSGYLASSDGVSIDKAAMDLIKTMNKEDVFLKNNKKSGIEQIKAASDFGMGDIDYSLQEY